MLGRESNGFLKLSFSFAYISYQAILGEGAATDYPSGWNLSFQSSDQGGS